MKTLTEKYNSLVEGNISRQQFLRDARLLHPDLVTQYNTFDDALTILINKGLVFPNLTEAKKDTEEFIDKFPLEAVDRGVDVELENMGLDSTDTPDDEEYQKALDKTLKNLEKDFNYYLNKISYPEKKKKVQTTHPSGNVDTVNKMVKVNPEKLLKESIKNIIRNILTEEEQDSVPRDIGQSDREKNIEIKNDLNSLLPYIDELVDLENADPKYIDEFVDNLRDLLKSRAGKDGSNINFDLFEGRKFTYEGKII